MITKLWYKSSGGDLEVSNSLQVAEGWEEVWADWGEVNHGVLSEIEEVTKVDIDPTKFYHDSLIEAEMIWKKMLQKASWFTVARVGGELDPVLFKENVGALDHRVFFGLIRPLTEDLFISQKESNTLYRQCIQLFAPGSGGVAYPNKWIKRYCELQTMWEKFGLAAYRSISDMPHAEYLRLRRIVGMEAERREYEAKAAKFRSQANTKGL